MGEGAHGMSRKHRNDPNPNPPQDPSKKAGEGKESGPATPSSRAAYEALNDVVRALDAAKDVPTGLDREDRGYRGQIVDRRVWPDRRNIVVDGQRLNPDGSPVTESQKNLERRRGPGRRLSDFTRAAEEGEMTKEQFLFLMAIDEFKKANSKAYPTWTDVLEVVRLLGYRKTMKSELSLKRAEDWFEAADSPANVRPQRWNERGKAPNSRDAA